MKFDPLAWEFYSRLSGTKTFLDAISHAVSEATAAEAAADRLKQRAESEGWPAEDYFAEQDVLEENFKHWLPRLSAYAVIVLLQSLVETQLHTCARRLRRDRLLNLDVKDLHGKGVLQAKKYLIKVANLDVANDLGWHELLNLQDVRNIISHRGGRPSPDQRDIVQRLLKEYPEDLALSPVRSHGLVNKAEQELTIAFRLCSHFLREIDAFFYRLFKVAGFQESPIEL